MEALGGELRALFRAFQLDCVFSLFAGNKELENRCCTVQILNFYCPKLESISSVLNCLLLALVHV